MSIIHARKLVKPLPHLVYAYQPTDMDKIKEGFLTMCGIDAYTAGSGCELHFHDCIEYWFIVSGKAKLKIGDKEDIVGPHSLSLTPIGVNHQFTAIEDTEVLWVYGQLSGKERVGHLHDEDRDAPGQTGENVEKPIIHSKRLDGPLPKVPHLHHAYAPDQDAVSQGFLSMTGWDYYAAGSECDMHFHDCDEYWFILHGNAIARVGDEEAEVGHGDVVFTPMGARHHFKALDDCCMLWMYGEMKGKKRVGHVHNESDAEAWM